MSISLRKNMEMVDRAIHAGFGTALVVSGTLIQGIIGLILVLLSAPLLLSAIIGFCPGYDFFRMATRGNSMLNGSGETKGNDEIVSAGIESLWLMPRGIYDEAYGQRVKRANS